MSSPMVGINFKTLFRISLLALIGCVGVLGFWFVSLDQQVKKRLSERRYAPPVEFYAAPQRWYVGERLTAVELKKNLLTLGYRKRKASMRLLNGDFAIYDPLQCRKLTTEDLPPTTRSCLLLNSRKDQRLQLAVFNEESLAKAFSGAPLKDSKLIQLDPILFAQYYDNRPILRQIKKLSDYPNQCLDAVLALEDPSFLDHKGISLRGILRAFYVNIIQRKRSQGGSTITQQLIKNILLSHEKTIKRKVTEIGMAIIFEFRVPKDQILETYLNIVYMGQNGAYAVSGFGAAAHHYFSKPIESLGLNECSALAAILNNPGLYNPFRYPERTRKRQARALKKMTEHSFITQEDAEVTLASPLPIKRQQGITAPAPYYVDAVRRKLKEMQIDSKNGLRIFTAMNPQAQKAARKSLQDGLDALESWFVHLKVKAEKKQPLQGLIVSSNPYHGEIEALVGGRNFKKYPYNRAIRAHRQVGSVIKPFVYLAALEALDENGAAITPITRIRDEKFEHKYDGQIWSPENYGKEFNGLIPLFFGLKNSLNAATAALGIGIGLPSVIDVLKRVGIKSDIEALPAMTLGAYELYPTEVLSAYTTLSRFGSKVELTLIRSVESLDGDILYKYEPKAEQIASKETVGALIGMMKQTVLNGTGQVTRKLGFTKPAAGKTGTTSDARDSWFSGFTPYHAASVWVGYDNNDIHGLTGATGAAPIWANYMKSYAAKYPNRDFPWPSGVTSKTLNVEEQRRLGVPEPKESIELIFRKGNEP